MNEWMIVQNMMQALGGGGQVWFSLGWLLCLVAIMVFRSEAIRHRGLFRWSCTLFALSFMVPPFLQLGIYYYSSVTSGGMGSRYNAMDSSPLFMMLPSAVGPFLLGLSLIFGFAALSPPMRESNANSSLPPQPPEKHPLD